MNFHRPPDENRKREYVQLPEGNYVGYITQIRPGVSHEKKTPYVAVNFAVHQPGGEYHDHAIDIKLWESDGAYDFRLARLLELVNLEGKYDKFNEIAAAEGLEELDEALHFFRVKGKFYKFRVEHTQARNNPDKVWVNIVKLRQIETPKGAETPKAQSEAPRHDRLEEEF